MKNQKQDRSKDYPKTDVKTYTFMLECEDGRRIEFSSYGGSLSVRLSESDKTTATGAILHFNHIFDALKHIIEIELKDAPTFDWDDNYVDPKGVETKPVVSKRRKFAVRKGISPPEKKPPGLIDPSWVKAIQHLRKTDETDTDTNIDPYGD